MKKTLLLFLTIGLIYFLREPKNQVHEFNGIAMTVPYRILVGQPLNHAQILQIEETIETLFAHTFNVYNKWNPHSELSQLNSLNPSIEFEASHDLFQLLQLSDQIWKKTSGRFDPTVESNCIGWESLQFADGKVIKQLESKLDLCGIAKGQTIDELTEKLILLGYQHLLVEWGGDFRAKGSHPSQRPWKLSIKNPLGTPPPRS